MVSRETSMKKIFVNILAGLLVLAGIAAFSACDRGEPNTSSAPTEVSFVVFLLHSER